MGAICFIKVGGDSGAKCAIMTPLRLKAYLSGEDFDERPDPALCYPRMKSGGSWVGCSELANARYRAFSPSEYLSETIIGNNMTTYDHMLMLRPISAMNAQTTAAVMYLLNSGAMTLDNLSEVRLMLMPDLRNWLMRKLDE
jgi:hypothetical protein